MNLRQVIIIATTALMVAANMLFQQISYFLFGDVPDNYGKYYEAPTLISPKEFTFIIWAPIFIGMLLFSAYQAFPRNRKSQLLDSLLWPTIVINIFNGFSLYAPFGYNILVVVILLIGLGWAFVIIQRFKRTESVSFWFVEFPFTIFFAWISVALLVTTSQTLAYYEWTSFGLPKAAWAAVLVIIATGIGLFITSRYNAFLYALVLVWAFIGILTTNILLSNWLVASVLIICAVVLLTKIRKVQLVQKQIANE
ncbi:MAG: hypothetical protein AAFQ94_02440 [Bacteroidota bacterium]